MFDLNSLLNNQDIKAKLTEQAKNDIMKWIDDKVLPTAADTIDKVNEELRAQAEKETGWTKIRDGFFIPTVLTVILWVFKQANTLIATETTK